MMPTIPGYRLQRELGKGGMGMVYLAENEATGRQFALKVLPPHLLTPVTARRFQREGQALQRIDHPGIVRVHDVGARDGHHYIAMEYVRGAPLTKTLREHPRGLPLPVAQAIAVEIAAALSCIHERGMTHRDLKPGNVMVTEDGHTRLLDFGLVQVEGLTMLTATGNIVGTPRYMSPEQCAGQPIDCRSDIYSYGVLLYELLTGRPPFQSESVYELLEMQKAAAPPTLRSLRSEVPADWEEVTLRCLAKESDHRPRTLREVLAVLSPESTSVVGTGTGTIATSTPGRSAPGRGRALRWGAAALVVLAAGAGVLRLSRTPIALGLWPDLHAPTERHRAPGETIAHDPEQARGFYEEGRRQEALGNLQRAFEHYRWACESDPTEWRYPHALIAIASHLDRQSEARKVILAYMRQHGPRDPGGILTHWLEGH